MKRWFISDTHFSHNNIIKYTGRPFETVEEMNRCLINNWNDSIGKDDQVFFLGDFGLGDIDHLQTICSQLNGKKICIRGNHDKNADWMMRLGFQIVLESAFIKIGKHIVELIHIPSNPAPSHFQLHGHVHNKRPDKVIDNQLNLCVEIWDYKPVSEKSILKLLDTAPNLEEAEKLIAIEDLASQLGLSTTQVQLWIQKDKEKILHDFRGRPAVSDKLLEKYSASSDYEPAFRKAISAENMAKQNHKGMYEQLKIERFKLLKFYESCFHKLASIHKKYIGLANGYGHESPEIAGFLLFSRAITTLKMFCSSQKEGFWYSGALIREIDESVALAQYFILTKDSKEGKKNLHKWFRQNNIPGNSHCRKATADRMNQFASDNEKNSKQLLDEIYNKKSKFTHPSYAAIRDVLDYELTDQGIFIKKFEYGICSNEEKMYELTHFFESSIWTVFQAFYECFLHLPITSEDRQFLKGMGQLFLERAQSHQP